MLNFVVFHLFPVLNVLANDIWVTSGELGKSWDSVLAVLPRSGPLPWTLMSDSRNEILSLRAETLKTDWINTHLSLLFHCCFIADYVCWVVSDFHWYTIRQHVNNCVALRCQLQKNKTKNKTTPFLGTTKVKLASVILHLRQCWKQFYQGLDGRETRGTGEGVIPLFCYVYTWSLHMWFPSYEWQIHE